MSNFLHRRVRLFNTQGALIGERDLSPAIMEKALPHAILWQDRIFLLLERGTATYHEVMPHLLEYPKPKPH